MDKYIAIKYMNEAEHYPIQKLCAAVHYKVRIIDSLDRLDRTARNHGAVNVVGFSAAGERVGYNTDCVGFVRTMQTHGVEIKGDVCVLGAGGPWYINVRRMSSIRETSLI